MTDNIPLDPKALFDAASDGPAAWAIFDAEQDPVEQFREYLSFGSGDVSAVWLPEHPRTAGEHPRPDHAVLACVTGNGPASEANAKFFAWCLTNKARLLAALSSPEQGTEGVSEWERDPLGHAVRLLWAIETRYLAASMRERRKIVLELQEAKEEVVSVAVQLEIEKAAAKPRTGGGPK